MTQQALQSVSICLFNDGHNAPIPKIAMAVEERGFDGLFLPENTHMPVNRRQNLEFDAERLRALSGFYDPFVALSAAAAVTKRIKLGTSVCLLTHRDVLITAKAAASLDHMSEGRLILGVAGGLVAEAMENHGSPFKERWKIVREKCEVLRHIWESEVAAFEGDYVSFEKSHSYPKPYTSAGPPLWIGSNSAAVPGRVAEYADGWIVFNGRYKGDAIADLRKACDDKQRDFDELTVSLMDPPHNISGVEEFIDRGFERFIFIVRSSDMSDIEQQLDMLSATVESFR
ncbi:MAG: TIGR03619 family F420-dependent LLM class oxidoreductase [Gammaproteobacteria bacterium]